MIRSVLIVSLLALAGCAAIPKTPTHLTGQWGGEHVGLTLEGAIGSLDYDCASGTIDGAIFPAADGRFTATGSHRAGQGGPVRVGQIFTSQRASYAGTVDKDRMTLTVRLEDRTVMGPFTLVRGAPPQLLRCL